MFIARQPRVRPVNSKDHQHLANLIHFEAYVHRHLDWRSPLDWNECSPYLVAELDGIPQAVLICPPDPPDVAWIRLFAFSSAFSANEAWKFLWPAALEVLFPGKARVAAAIPLQSWFSQLLAKNQFIHAHDVVLLTHSIGCAPIPEPAAFNIRPLLPEDLPAIAELDLAAFGYLWRNSLDSLKVACEQAALGTVVEDANGLLGYQITTAGPMGAHLARLAIHPRGQGRGAGYSLVHHLIHELAARNVSIITVNTQMDNIASLALYQKAGFRLTGEGYPVYLYQ